MAADPPLDRRARGARVEAAARAELERAGLRLQAANVGYRGGELDLVMHEPGSEGGTLVFVEVRYRAGTGFGGGFASVDHAKGASWCAPRSCTCRDGRGWRSCHAASTWSKRAAIRRRRG